MINDYISIINKNTRSEWFNNKILDSMILGYEEDRHHLRIGEGLKFENSKIIGMDVQIGTIVMWSGKITDIPENWQLCDGTNGTPNLIDRFIKGASTNSGASGGSHNIVLTTQNLPEHIHIFNPVGSHAHNMDAHSHTVTKLQVSSNDGNHTHSCFRAGLAKYGAKGLHGNGGDNFVVNGPDRNYDNYTINGHYIFQLSPNHIHTITMNIKENKSTINSSKIEGRIENSGYSSPKPLDNRPLFYELAFIMKIKMVFDNND